MSYNLSCPQGDTWSGLTVEFLIADSPVDLTGATIKMQLRKTYCDTAIAHEFSTENGSIVVDAPATGIFAVEPTIMNISPKQYVYDIEVTLSSGRVITIVSGNFLITPTVTR
jgi:hypothetical protein